MRKNVRIVLVCIICFFSILCMADTKSILVDKREVIVPTYEGFNLITDMNAPEYKKIESEFNPDTNTVSYGYYYETNPGKQSRLISILGFKDITTYVSKNQWNTAKNDIYEDSQKPIMQEKDNAKAVQVLTDSITNNELYNTYITETKVYIKENNKYRQALNILDSKTYIYLNGKIVVIMITIEGDNAYNVSTLEWAKKISQATAEKLIELNPPNEDDLKMAKNAEKASEVNHIKIAILIIIGIIGLLWKFGSKYISQRRKINE